MEKELKIKIPEGYEIDKENSTFEKIVFKEKTIRWRDDTSKKISGWFISQYSSRIPLYNEPNNPDNYCLFATETLAKKALAMARISQILFNDERFGKCYFNGFCGKILYQIKIDNQTSQSIKIIQCKISEWDYDLLSFDTANQAALFIKENWDLLFDYFTVKKLYSPYIPNF